MSSKRQESLNQNQALEVIHNLTSTPAVTIVIAILQVPNQRLSNTMVTLPVASTVHPRVHPRFHFDVGGTSTV